MTLQKSEKSINVTKEIADIAGVSIDTVSKVNYILKIAKKVGCDVSTVSKVLKYLPQIIQGDCLKELDNIQTNSIDLIYVDPPYFILDKKKAKWDVFNKPNI